MAQADPEDIARIIRSIGFYRTKAKNCIACAQMIMSDFGGEVPRDMDQMQKLPGVGRKTANVVLNEAFGIVEGIAVDTHVFRIAHKLKFAGPSADTPRKQRRPSFRCTRVNTGGPSTINGCCLGERPA